MKINASSLTGPLLAWAVMECEYRRRQANGEYVKQWVLDHHAKGESTREVGADEVLEIQERERILVREFSPIRDDWEAEHRRHHINVFGPTARVAILRCYVATNLGDDLDIPDQVVSSLTKAPEGEHKFTT